MLEFYRRGVDVFGVDISSDAIIKTKQKGLKACLFDLTVPSMELPGVPYDIAISCEVAEHLKEEYAGVFCEKLVGSASIIYLTAAEPSKKNTGSAFHYNEQPNSYWIDIMSKKGFEFDRDTTDNARAYLRENKVISYLRIPMIFRKLPSDRKP